MKKMTRDIASQDSQKQNSIQKLTNELKEKQNELDELRLKFDEH